MQGAVRRWLQHRQIVFAHWQKLAKFRNEITAAKSGSINAKQRMKHFIRGGNNYSISSDETKIK